MTSRTTLSSRPLVEDDADGVLASGAASAARFRVRNSAISSS